MSHVDADLDLDELFESTDDRVRVELGSKPEIKEWSNDFDVKELAIKERKWIQIPEVVAVLADLKNSTHLGTGKHAASTASIYEAATGGVVAIYNKFKADFIAIQGDGAFALFWGSDRFERAVSCGITVKTFSERQLVPRLETKWEELKTNHPTGFKVGISSGRVLVKRVGTPRNFSEQEPIWAGVPVNFASKAAQQSDRHELIITASVWKAIRANDYLTLSCPCNGGPAPSLWSPVEVRKIPESNSERQGQLLSNRWCQVHGDSYVKAILRGETTRRDATKVRKEVDEAEKASQVKARAEHERADLRARRLKE
jgi:class 3 adenylate cyclase